ncbi:hypothetical protein N752_28950 [Desulforamulus aquiferis]|nr:class I SAM-dependent methyltransferase [Desulforamulus aquiferis]RYD01607.1 hypothetical protein N752_28950 [Desulforamulus aquiferis]
MSLTGENMSSNKTCKLYEGNAIRQVTGDSIRPGGFRLTDQALNLCALPQGVNILDIGCGTGATVEYLITKNNYNAVGVDPSEILLAKGRQRTENLPILQAAGEALPFEQGVMDCIFAECTLSVMENPDLALQECHRVLKKKGCLVVTDIYVRNQDFVSELHKLPLASCLTGARTRLELEAKLSKAGFRVSYWQDHSELLKELVFKLIMSYGSMNNFWQQAGSGVFDVNWVQAIIKGAKPATSC